MLGPYRLERVLGTGTFATVWLARDQVLDRAVAIKILADNWSRDLDVRRRFLSEARVMLTAESARILRGFELDETPLGQPYLVMTLADRGTLEARITDRRRTGVMFSAQEAAAICEEIALGVADVHALGHLHRDIKPSNVLVRSTPASSSSPVPSVAGLQSGEQLMIGDFGLARGIAKSAITLVAGSPGYVAPEQAAGLVQLDERADLYPIGRILLELLSGDPGGRATTMSGAATEHVDATAILAASDVTAPTPVPDGLVDLAGRLLATDPAGRPGTALEVARALSAYSRPLAPPGPDNVASGLAAPRLSRSASGVRATAKTATSPWRRRRGPLLALSLLVGVVAVIVALLAVGGPSDDPGSTLTDGSAEPDSTVAVDASGSAGPTSISTNGTAVRGGSGEELPLPDIAAVQSNDRDRVVAVVALSVDDVVAHFEGIAAPWSPEGSTVRSAEQATLQLLAPGRRATVVVEPTAVTAGEGISSIVVTYTSP